MKEFEYTFEHHSRTFGWMRAPEWLDDIKDAHFHVHLFEMEHPGAMTRIVRREVIKSSVEVVED